MRRDAGRRRVRAHQQDDEACIGHGLQIRLQTSDVMTAPDHHRDNGMRENPVARFGDRLLHEPMSRQAMTVPGKTRAEIRDDFGIACRCEPPFLYLYEIARELIETVGIVAQKIRFDHDVGHRPRAVARHTRALEQGRGKHHQLVGAIPSQQAS